MKRCSSCKEEKAIKDFSKGQHWCKICFKQYTIERSRAVVIAEVGEKTCSICYQTFPINTFTVRRQSADGRNASCRPCTQSQQGSSRAGLSLEQYSLLLSQGCGICKDIEGELHIDHDHSCCPGRRSCGKCVRAALCEKHNIGLGCFRDNPEMLRLAADYLESFVS